MATGHKKIITCVIEQENTRPENNLAIYQEFSVLNPFHSNSEGKFDDARTLCETAHEESQGCGQRSSVATIPTICSSIYNDQTANNSTEDIQTANRRIEDIESHR